MAIKTGVLAIFFQLMCLLSCSTDGGDVAMHYFDVDGVGRATVTRVSQDDGITYIDFLWQARNNIGEPEHVENVSIADIKGFPPEQGIAPDDVLILLVTRSYEQRGVSTPVLKQSDWIYIR